jgi:nucleotide-binding universal stress UspA family protein
MASYDNIMVGTDGSKSSFRAVERAALLAAESGATLHLVSAYRPMSTKDRARAADQLGDLAYKVAGATPAEDALTDAESIARKAGAGSVEKHALEGDPVDALIDAVISLKADLLVVGNRGLNSLAGRLLGSVPQNVSHRAACDVLIVHTTS